MMRRLLLAMGLLLPLPAGASSLDEAIQLVNHAHPVIQAEEERLAALKERQPWSMDLLLGWARRGTQEVTTGGANAGVQVTIPLFDRSHDLEIARERAAVLNARQQIHARFLEAVERLRGVAADKASAHTQRDFARDRLTYGKQQVEQGLIEAADLWPIARAANEAEVAFAAAEDALAAQLDATARRYGGEQWQTLKRLLAEHLKSSVP